MNNFLDFLYNLMIAALYLLGALLLGAMLAYALDPETDGDSYHSGATPEYCLQD